jgi:hypothetical protein
MSKMKINKKIRNIIIIVGVILAVALILMLIGNKMRADAIKAENYQDWLFENCNCLAHNHPYCSEGFKLNGTLCFNDKTKEYTTRTFGCSEYNCSGEIKVWNNITETWEN